MHTQKMEEGIVIGPRMEEIHQALQNGDLKAALELFEKEVEYNISI